MSEGGEKRKVPKIRFPGFTDEWEQSKLCDVAKFKQGNQVNLEDQYSNYIDGRVRFIRIVDYTQNNDDVRYIDKIANANYVSENDVVIVRYGANAGFVGHGIIGVIANNMFTVKPSNVLNKEYLYTFLKRDEIHKILNSANGSSAMPAINFNIMSNLDILYPSISEQNKISAFFKVLSSSITLHQQKLDDLKELKKGLLQKMFPAEGKNVPEIRFPGFTNSWEQRKLSDIGVITTGFTPSTSDDDNYGGEYFFVSPVDIQGNRYIDKTVTTLTAKGFKNGREIRGGASLFVSIGSTIGKVGQTVGKAATNQQINAVEPYDKYDDDFVFSLLETQSSNIKAIASNQAVPIVNKTTFSETDVLVPITKKEQQEIGQYFKSLDTLITLHQRKLDDLKELKKGLLQQMFI